MARLTLDPDSATVEFDDPFDQGKAHACPFAMSIQLVEQTKDIFMELLLDANPVISHVQDRHTLLESLLANLNGWRFLIAHKFAGIIN